MTKRYVFNIFLLSTLVSLIYLGFKVNNDYEQAKEQRVKLLNYQENQTALVPTPPLPTPTTKQLAKKGETKGVSTSSGYCRFVPILMYHHIDNQPGGLYIRTDIFENQMNYLVQKGYQTKTLSEIIQAVQSKIPLPPKSIAITFDDGYRDFYTQAYPILKSLNLKATVFVVTQLMDGQAYLTWSQLSEMVGSGLITAGDHTLSHKNLPNATFDQTRDEIISAKNILEEKLGVKVNVFAYPYGGLTPEAEKILKEGNFVGAVLNRRGSVCAGNPYEIGRVRVGNVSLSTLGL